jgi:UDP-glucose 4-epimerase
MRVLVTGGAGFVGSHLVHFLLEEGHDVVVLDNLVAGKKENAGDANFMKGDITEKQDVAKASKDVDAVFHLAAIVDVRYSMSHPEETRKTNVLGTKNVIDANIGKGIVYVSSAAVYGDAKELPIKESSPLKPISPYGESKVLAEKECLKHRDGTKISIIRPFNIYGPGQDPRSQYSGVITKFIDLAKAGKPLTIYGDGGQTRDFVYISDVCEALIASLGEKGTYNIGSGKQTSVNEIAKYILELSGSRSKIVHEAAKPGDIRNSYADTTLAGQELGWRPRVGLRDGLRGFL